MNGSSLIAVSVGNTRTAVGVFNHGSLDRSLRFPHADLDELVQTILSAAAELDVPGLIAMASVHDEIAMELSRRLASSSAFTIATIGDDIPIPIGEALDPETLTGTDRLLNAAAAWDRLRQACIIVDAGTAVTVDFVDGTGVFQGGAIAPGARMQLVALHAHTSALPNIDFSAPDAEAFGRNTRQAMLNGVYYGIRGLVWKLVERYSEAYGAFPLVLATGGDAATIFEGDELINRVVPDLTLHGIEVAVRLAMRDDAVSDSDRAPS